MLAIAGGKGGCGKTTTTVGVATALARMGLTPLVADMDIEMPDLHLVVDVPDCPGLPALARGESPTSVAHTPSDRPGLAVVPAGDGTIDTTASAVTQLRDWDGPVLLDCPAGAARDAAVPLRQADRTLLVTTPQPQTLRDTAKTAEMARTLDAPPVGVVVVDLPASQPERDPQLSESVTQRLFGCSVLGQVPAVTEPPLQVEIVRTAYETVAKKVTERNV